MNSSVVAQLHSLRKQGRSIVLCHGVFDILHPGHLDHFKEAKTFGDVLVVSITSDEFVNKGPGRPVLSASSRSEMLGALEIVDFVLDSPYPSAVENIILVRPDVYVKGRDYQDSSGDSTGNIEAEASAVQSVGGRLVTTTSPSMSSSNLLNNSRLVHRKEAYEWVTDLAKDFSQEEILDSLHSIADMRVAVVGELILDKYVFCEALGKSGKDPLLAFRRRSEEVYGGGSLAIAAHCRGLGADVTLVTQIGSDGAAASFLEKSRESGIKIRTQVSSHRPTIVKTRFVDEKSGNRVFEQYEMNDSAPVDDEDLDFAENFLSDFDEFDAVLIADYGHGLLSDNAIRELTKTKAKLCLNTQSNAGNRGINSPSRYPKTHLISLNGDELIAEHRRKPVEVVEVLPEIGQRLGATWLVITQGVKGLALWHHDGKTIEAPSFTTDVRDLVGAGDAVFAVVSLLLSKGTHPAIAAFFANIAGGSMVSSLANKQTVSLINVERHAKVLLA